MFSISEWLCSVTTVFDEFCPADDNSVESEVAPCVANNIDTNKLDQRKK